MSRPTLCKALTRLLLKAFFFFAVRVYQTYTWCSQPSHCSGTFFSAVSLLTDVNYAENAGAMSVKSHATDRNGLLKTQMSCSVAKNAIVDKSRCNALLILASRHSI